MMVQSSQMKSHDVTKRKRPRLWAVVPDDLHTDVKLYAAEHRITMQEFVAEAVVEKLARDRRSQIEALR